VPLSQIAQPSPGHAWLCDLLFTAGPTVTWAPAGGLPDGFARVEQFAVLSSGGGRSFMVSLAARAGTSSAFTSYNALRPRRKRLARSVLGLGLRTGLAQPLMREKVDVGVSAGASPADRAADLLTAHLEQLLGRGPVVVAVGGGGGPYRKPVLQVFSPGGVPLGYIKVGWNDWTRDSVRREAAALRACADHPMRVGVPGLLGVSQWHGLDLLITAPLPRGVRRLASDRQPPDAQSLREISELAPGYAGELAGSPWWLGVRSRIQDAVIDPGARAALDQVAARVERGYGNAVLAFGTWHGDLVPWNLARLGQRLYAWDWESSGPDAPLGFDALHFYFQVGFVARGRPLGQAARQAAEAARPVLRELGVAADSCELVATLHLIELALRHEEARNSAGDSDQRFYPAITDVLRQALPPGTRQVGQDPAEQAA
jgi:hypothetical protein